MATKPGSVSSSLVRSLAMGVLLSLLVTYLLHVFGDRRLQQYRPDPDTTSSLILYNKCAVFGRVHTLRPNYEISSISDGVDRTKLFGSFMNFSDGHIVAMVVLALVLGMGIFALRRMIQKA